MKESQEPAFTPAEEESSMVIRLPFVPFLMEAYRRRSERHRLETVFGVLKQIEGYHEQATPPPQTQKALRTIIKPAAQL